MPTATPRPELIGLRPGRVCVVKPSALGDVANAFSTLSALRDLWPSASFSWVINQSLRGLVDGHPGIDQVIPYDRARIGFHRQGLRELGSFLSRLRQERFDLAIDLQGLLRSGLITAATGAPTRVGLADAREGARCFYTHTVVPPGSRDHAHAIDRLHGVAAAFGADLAQAMPLVAMSYADRDWARTALAPLPKPRLGLNIGARWETKRWPPRQFAEVARRAVEQFHAGLFALGAPEDRPLVEALRGELGPIPLLDFCGGTTLPRLAALAAESDLILSNDTGPLHLAVAAGARVVGVYACTKPELNGPYGPLAVSERSLVACAGSYKVRCPFEGSDRLACMGELTPDRVWPLVHAQLSQALAADPVG